MVSLTLRVQPLRQEDGVIEGIVVEGEPDARLSRGQEGREEDGLTCTGSWTIAVDMATATTDTLGQRDSR